MFLYLSAAMFSLVALQLSATVMKTRQEGRNAFLVSRIQSSELPRLAQSLQESLTTRDTRMLRLLLDQARISSRVEGDLWSLQDSEVLSARDFENRYNLILYYLPDDLKEFFGECRILWDVENLKLLVCCITSAKSQNNAVRMAGPFGYLNQEAIAALAGANDFEELIAQASSLLPSDYSSKLALERLSSAISLEIALDFAAFSFLENASKDIGTQRVELAWQIFQSLYEIRNVLTISRLKLYKIASEEIEPMLFPVCVRLGKSEYKDLLEARDHQSFLRILERTSYGKGPPERAYSIDTLRGLMRRAEPFGVSGETEPETEKIIRFVTELEVNYETVREATFLTMLKALDEE